MKNAKKLSVACLAVGVIAIVATATSALAAKPIGGGGCGPRNCLDVWRPVICPNGQVYSNDCYAARACQTNCVPYGGDAI
jgi:hypothetical protein